MKLKMSGKVVDNKLVIYEIEVVVHSFQLDVFGRLKPHFFANILEEVSQKHAAELGFASQDISRKGFFWVLGQINIDIKRFPVRDEKLIVRTAICEFSGFTSIRGFEIFVGEVLVAEMACQWLLLDKESRRPVRLTEVLEMPATARLVSEKTKLFDRVSLPEDAISVGSREIAYSDLDTNQHMNNAKYIEWALDKIPYEWLAQKRMSFVKVNFLAELLYLDKVELFSKGIDDKEYIVYGLKDGKPAFAVGVLF